MKIISDPTSLDLLWKNRESSFEEMIKIVVDIKLERIGIDAEMHADIEQILLNEGSAQQDLWGANIYPLREENERLEYTSLINIRPAAGNRSMEVQNPDTRIKIKEIVNKYLV
jgi:hypothetical protein